MSSGRAASGLDAARELHLRGRAAMSSGSPAEASRLLRKARAIVASSRGDDAELLQARVLITLANAEFELDGLRPAMTRLDEAEAAIERHRLDQLRISLANQRGLLLLRAGRVDAAIAQLDMATRFADAGAAEELCKVLLNRAVAHMDNFQLQRARADLERCAQRARAAGQSLLELKATHNLGFVEYLSGNLPAALQLMDEAYAMDPSIAPGIAKLGKAEVLVAAGLVREADATLAEAGAIFRRDRLTQDLGETELERARCALLDGDAQSARRLAMRARNRFRRRGNDRWRRHAELVLLQAELEDGRPPGRLSGPALRLSEQFGQDGVRLPARTAALIAAEAHLGSGRTGAAQDALARAGRSGSTEPITARLHRGYVQAQFELATGHRAVGARRVRAALADLAGYQASFGGIDLATAAAVHGRRLAALDLSLALATGRPDAVLVAAERSRAVSTRLVAVRPPGDPAYADLLARLRQTVDALRTDDRVPALHRQRRELESAVAARGWTRVGAGVVGEAVAVEQVRAALGDATLVAFVRHADLLHAVVIGSSAGRLVQLGPAAAVDELVRRVRADLDVVARPQLPAQLRAAIRASLSRSLAAIDDALLTPLRIGGPLVVVSTGVLCQLPWGLLPSLAGRPVVVAPSATAWHAAHTRKRSVHKRVTAIAGPGLTDSSSEATTVASYWPHGQSLVGDTATGARVASALSAARILHVAAHGVHHPENPLFSWVRLADGPLFAHELDQTAGVPEHVVLSACELGLATIRPGDETLGLTAVLLQLGTRSVVGGVARVADDAAAATMIDYHARLRNGADSASALADAVAATGAPFVCFGATFSA
jgi:tetratricopeptide (TPR) repeat protein